MFPPKSLPLLVVFAAIARRGSFTGAARELGLSKSVVSDHLRSLEELCAARLLERTTRRVRLTQIGERLLTVADQVADAPRDVDAVLEEHRDAPVGTLRIATTHDLNTRFVAPLVARLAARHPQLRVDVVSDDAPRDLIAERFDVAVRLGAPRDSALVMRKLAVFGEPVVAAPALAARFAAATRPRDLAGAPWVQHALLPSQGDTWKLRGPHGAVETVTVTTRARTNTGDGVRALVLGGVGLAVLPAYQVADDLRSGALVRLCPDWVWKHVTLYAVLPSAKRQPKRVEVFVAALAEALGNIGVTAQPRR